MSEYRVAIGDSRSELISEVAQLLAEGFLPQGGIAVSQGIGNDEYEGWAYYYQAMFRSDAQRVQHEFNVHGPQELNFISSTATPVMDDNK